MNDSNQQTPFDLEQIELKTDVQIARSQDPQPPTASSSKAWPVVVLLGILTLGGCAAAVFYYLRYEEVRESYSQLKKEISTASESLNATSGSLEETREALSKSQTAVQRMRDEIDKRKKDVNQLTKDKQKLEADLTKNRKALEAAEKASRSSTTKLSALESQTKKLENERDQLKQALTAKETEIAQKVDDLNAALETSQAQATNQAQAYREQERALQANLRKLENDITQMRQQAASESEAGMAIIRERGQLKSENERLKADLQKAMRDLGSAQNQIKRLSSVQTGDLVPYSDEISPAQVRFRAPLPEGVRLPRSLGQVTIMTLIDENGAVEKAFLLPGQELDGIIARDIIAAVYQWKFRPAQQGNTRVKLWQPIVFEP